MKALRALTGLAAAAMWMMAVPVQAASASNSPTFRDCALPAGLDPDFVELSGAMLGPDGKLTVTKAQAGVTLTASESSDSGDNAGKDTFTVKVSAPGVATKTVSGMGTGKVVLTIPLGGAAVGSAYTLNWSATFDGGSHACPGSFTPQNPASTPFVLNVVANGSVPPPTPPVITNVGQSHRDWRESNAPIPGHRHQPPVGTAFTFGLSEPATVRLAFSQRLSGRRVKGRCVSATKKNRKHPACERLRFQGTLIQPGNVGGNRIAFRGKVSGSNRIGPGRYVVVMIATNASGQRSKPRSLRFTIAG
jgi:hypothetical protein